MGFRPRAGGSALFFLSLRSEMSMFPRFFKRKENSTHSCRGQFFSVLEGAMSVSTFATNQVAEVTETKPKKKNKGYRIKLLGFQASSLPIYLTTIVLCITESPTLPRRASPCCLLGPSLPFAPIAQ